MEDKMIYIPVDMFREGVEAIAKCRAIEHIVAVSEYRISPESLAMVLGIEGKEEE